MKFTKEGLAFVGVALFVISVVAVTQINVSQDSAASITEGGSPEGATTASSSIQVFNLVDNEDGCSDSTFDTCYRHTGSDGQAEADAIIQADGYDVLYRNNGVSYVEEGEEIDYACGEDSEYNDGISHQTYAWFDKSNSYEWDKDGDREIEGVPEPTDGDYEEISNEGSFEIDWTEPQELTLSCVAYQSHWQGDWVWAAQGIVWNNDIAVAQDSDNDGVYDQNDECPNKGDQGHGLKDNGCPIVDSDGDGISDNKDACPQTAGDESADGCPDADGDGVKDSEDEFPRDADCQEDSDGDGVCDNEDAFPNDPNRQADSDGDGVADSNDLCPETPAGSNGINGCPDSDGDGVADKNDACSQQGDQGFGLKDDGCPVEDSDGDGVGDDVDVCQDTPEEAEVTEKGCAVDSDNDGVADYKDQCSNTPSDTPHGVDNKGCAIQDADGDGVVDSEDECTNTYGTDQGCPTIIDSIINTLGLRGVIG